MALVASQRADEGQRLHRGEKGWRNFCARAGERRADELAQTCRHARPQRRRIGPDDVPQPMGAILQHLGEKLLDAPPAIVETLKQ